MYKLNINDNTGNSFEYNIFNFNKKYYVEKIYEGGSMFYSCSKKALILIFNREFKNSLEYSILLYRDNEPITDYYYFVNEHEEDNLFNCIFLEFLEILDEFEDDNNLEVNKQMINTTYNNITKKLPKELVDIILK